MAKEIILVNKVEGMFTINFRGDFPNKTARRKGQKIYLTEKEFDYVKNNYPEILGEKVVLEGEEVKEETSNVDAESLFELHHAKAKKQISEMTDKKEIDDLIHYANMNELNNSVVDALVEKSNELEAE